MPLQEALMWVGIVVSSIFIYWYLRPDEDITEATTTPDSDAIIEDSAGGEVSAQEGVPSTPETPYGEQAAGDSGLGDNPFEQGEDGLEVKCDECGEKNDYEFDYCRNCAAELGF